MLNLTLFCLLSKKNVYIKFIIETLQLWFFLYWLSDAHSVFCFCVINWPFSVTAFTQMHSILTQKYVLLVSYSHSDKVTKINLGGNDLFGDSLLLRDIRKGRWTWSWSHHHAGPLLAGTALCLARFLLQLRLTCPWMVPPPGDYYKRQLLTVVSTGKSNMGNPPI